MVVAGVVLAGGRSSRMGGRDKAFIPFGGGTLVARAVARLRPQVVIVAVNANGSDPRLAALGVPVVADTVGGLPGPLAGIAAGLAWAAAEGATHAVTAAVDTPFFPADLAARLADAAGADGVAVARSDGRLHPVFALLPVGLAGDAAAFLASDPARRVSDWLARHAPVAVDFVPTEGIDPFFNVNTPDDLAAAEAAAGCAAR